MWRWAVIKRNAFSPLEPSGDDPVLCCVRWERAYFTSGPLETQDGDHWHSCPFEHNAGEPDERNGRITVIDYWASRTPWEYGWGDCLNSWKVIWQINGTRGFEKEMPWLKTSDGREQIWAGTPLSEFKRLLKKYDCPYRERSYG